MLTPTRNSNTVNFPSIRRLLSKPILVGFSPNAWALPTLTRSRNSRELAVGGIKIGMYIKLNTYLSTSDRFVTAFRHFPRDKHDRLRANVPSSSLDDSLDPARHGLDEAATQRLVDRPPLLFQPLPEPIDRWKRRTATDAPFQHRPKLLDRVHVGALRGPRYVATWFFPSQAHVCDSYASRRCLVGESKRCQGAAEAMLSMAACDLPIQSLP